MNNSIKPGKIWLDEDGQRIHAHGAYMYYENDTYYWYGENKEFTQGKDKTWTSGIRYYSSKDLYNWKDEGLLIPPSDDKESPLHSSRMVDRPHIIKCPKTKKFVAWLKYEDTYDYCILQADSFFGPYEFVKISKPSNGKCGDFDLACDEKTGKGYGYFEINHLDLSGYELTDDFTDVKEETKINIYENIKPPFTREGPAHFERNGKHYLVSSSMTGYIPNRSEVCVSDDYLGKYEIIGDPCVDDDSDATFNSQISCIFKVQGKDEYIMMADRWLPNFMMTKETSDKLRRTIAHNFYKEYKATFSEIMWLVFKAPMNFRKCNTSIADFVFLPLVFEDDKVLIKWQDEWSV